MKVNEGVRESKINFEVNDKLNVLILINHHSMKIYLNECLRGEFRKFMTDITIKRFHKDFEVRGALTEVVEFKNGVIIEINKKSIYIYDSMTQFLQNKKSIINELFFVPYLSA